MKFSIYDKKKKKTITEETDLSKYGIEFGLTYPDMETIALGMDGETLYLIDECGNYAYLDSKRFILIPTKRSNGK